MLTTKRNLTFQNSRKKVKEKISFMIWLSLTFLKLVLVHFVTNTSAHLRNH
jgi:hypothetical protein